jgi:hypothetical protein
MITPSEKQEAMEGLFHALWHLSSSNTTDTLEDLTNQLSGNPKTPNPRSSTQTMQLLVSMSKRLGEFDATLAVGDKDLPLVHALVEKKDISTKWMDVFKKTPEEYRIFEQVNGKSIGARFFDRMMKGSSLHTRHFKWWVENAPALDAREAAEWVEKLTSSNKKGDSYYSSSNDKAEDLLKLLLSRGASNEASNEFRPQERWSNSKIWWEAISTQDRMKEAVKGASGRLRPMQEALMLNNFSASFAQWVSGKDAPRARKAPHGRSKELVNNWILSSDDITVQERVRRLMLSVDASDRVMGELHFKANSTTAKDALSRDLLKQILLFRAPSGLSFRGMFALRFEESHSWSDFDAPLFEKDAPDFFVATDGAGLLLQEARQSVSSAITEPNEYRTISGLRNFPGKGNGWKRNLIGEDKTHQELVDLLVDGIISRKPYHHFVSIAKFIITHDLLTDQVLDDKLKQAVALSALPYHFQSLRSMQENEGRSNKKPRRDWLVEAADKLEPVAEVLASGNWQLAISEKDWDTLSEGWGITKSLVSYAGSRFAAIMNTVDADIRAWGSRLEIDETTAAPSAIGSARPRL